MNARMLAVFGGALIGSGAGLQMGVVASVLGAVVGGISGLLVTSIDPPAEEVDVR